MTLRSSWVHGLLLHWGASNILTSWGGLGSPFGGSGRGNEGSTGCDVLVGPGATGGPWAWYLALKITYLMTHVTHDY